jgi:hypothetical protein
VPHRRHRSRGARLVLPIALGIVALMTIGSVATGSVEAPGPIGPIGVVAGAVDQAPSGILAGDPQTAADAPATPTPTIPDARLAIPGGPPPLSGLSGYRWPLPKGRLTQDFGPTAFASRVLNGQPFHDGLRLLVGELNALYRREPALYEKDFSHEGFQWLQCDDWQNSVFAFVRYAKNRSDCIVCVMNMTPVPRPDYRIGVPAPGYYGEIMNTDAAIYGGANLGNLGGTTSEPLPLHGCQQSISIQLPPLAMVLFFVVTRGFQSLNFEFFTNLPRPVGEPGGGMRNAIVGTLMLTGLAAAIAVPIGVVRGIYLSQ